MRDPTKIAEKQISRLSGAVSEIQAGVQGVTESPTEKAAARADIAQQNYVAAITSGKMQRNLRSVTLADWQSKTVAKVGRIPEGIEQAKPLLVRFHTQREVAQTSIDNALKPIVKRTLADSIRRATVQIEGMAKFSFDRSK